MAILPTVDQFPTFAHALFWLAKRARQCIWYLPDKERCCSFKITDEVNQSALHLAEGISKAGPLTKKALQVLADIAEQSCCVCCHRNKMWGSGLSQKLAVRWHNEIQVTLSVTNCKTARTVELESVSHSLPPGKPVAFAKHEVLEGATLWSKLSSPINLQAGKIGSLYIFTHTKDAFHGMIKIGYTCSTINSRLSKWLECGHGQPVLLNSYHDVRHAERVELLTHFELLEYWYAQRWCKPHRQPHIEWFKIDTGTASSIARLWSLWMERANPYDRRGHLKAFWKETIDFLTMYEIPLAAELMMQIQEIEEGSLELLDFIDDDALRKRQEPVVKEEQFDRSQVAICLPQRIKAGRTAERDLEIKSSLVKTEVKELLSSFEMVTTTEVVTIQDGTPKIEVAGERNPSLAHADGPV